MDFTTHYQNENKMRVKWNQMEAQDVHADLPPLTIADMEFVTYGPIREAISDYLATQPLSYASASDAYFDSLIQWYQTQYSFTLDPQTVVLSNGVVSALRALIEIYTDAHATVAIFTPAYSEFFRVIKASQRNTTAIPLTNTNGIYTLDLEVFENTLKQCKPQLLILCNPHNPVGRVWTHGELTAIHTLATRYNVRIISDEIHADLRFGNHKHIVYNTIDPDAAIVSSASKSFNLAALQCAHVILPLKEDRLAWARYQASIMGHGPNVLGIVAAQAAYEKGAPWLEALLDILSYNNAKMREILKPSALVISPLEGTYLAWLDFRAYAQPEKALTKALSDAHIYLTPGTSFGTDYAGFFRLNLALPSDQLETVCNRILEVVHKL